MNKNEICKELAEKSGVSASQAGAVLDALAALVLRQVNEGEKLTLPKFGIFLPKHTAARSGRNPQTGASQEFPAKNTVRFRPATDFQRSIAQPSGS